MYKRIYTAYYGDPFWGRGVSFSTTNLRTLSERTEIGYHNLVRVFTREGRFYWVGPGGWVIIKSELFIRGKARNRGITGGGRFVKSV